MTKHAVSVCLGWVAVACALASCTLPGAALPTPFTFPTPNLTLTAMFAPTATFTPEPETLPPPETETPAAGTPAPTLPTPTGPTATTGALSTRPNGSVVSAVFLATAPTIDGNTAEWTSSSFIADRATFGAANWTGTSDASATYFLGWDGSHLYLAARVRDDRFVQGATGRYLYRGDSAEFLLDTNLASDFTSTVLSSDDYQIGLSPGNFASLSPEAYLWFPANLEGARANATVRARQTTDGYELEASIPWTILGITPTQGAHYGFAFSVSDNDSPGTTLQQTLVSSVSTRRLTNPTTWGTLVLN